MYACMHVFMKQMPPPVHADWVMGTSVLTLDKSWICSLVSCFCVYEYVCARMDMFSFHIDLGQELDMQLGELLLCGHVLGDLGQLHRDIVLLLSHQNVHDQLLADFVSVRVCMKVSE